MYIAVLVRRLRPGKTYEDFIAAWYPDRGFGVPVKGPYVARDLADPRTILVTAFVDLPEGASLDGVMERIAAQEAVRHDRIAEVIEATTLHGLYEVAGSFDFSTDETVAAGRPQAATP